MRGIATAHYVRLAMTIIVIDCHADLKSRLTMTVLWYKGAIATAKCDGKFLNRDGGFDGFIALITDKLKIFVLKVVNVFNIRIDFHGRKFERCA